MIFILTFILLGHFQTPDAHAFRGRLRSISDQNPETENWKTQHPKIVFALSLLDEKLNEHYVKVAKQFGDRLPDNFAEIKILSAATGAQIVRELQNPNTVGLVIIGHTYQTKSLKGSVFLGSDRQPLPTELLSAATPALRFFALLGCHARGALTQYQTQFEIEHIPGKQTVFYTDDSFLATNQLLGVDGVKHALKNLANVVSNMNFQLGAEAEAASVQLSLKIKDVLSGFEVRYVILNHRIVGTLGDSPETSNSDQSYKTISYPIRESAMNTARSVSTCQKISIRSAELSLGAPADDYLLSEVNLSTGQKRSMDPALHFGDQPKPYLAAPPIAPTLSGNKEEDQILVIQYVSELARIKEWLDPDARHWPVLSGRFYSDCL